MVKVKICGITNSQDALAAAEAGADALGFVFFKLSPRYISPRKAKSIIEKLPRKIIKIGVFVDAAEKDIKSAARLCRLDMLQFHGGESPQFCRRFKGYKIIKAFRVKKRIDKKDILRYKVFAYLFDAFARSKAGGTGRKFDWRLLRGLGLARQVFLSGGLNALNLEAALRLVKPQWVDVSSSVEARPGKKSLKKIREFIRAAKKP